MKEKKRIFNPNIIHWYHFYYVTLNESDVNIFRWIDSFFHSKLLQFFVHISEQNLLYVKIFRILSTKTDEWMLEEKKNWRIMEIQNSIVKKPMRIRKKLLIFSHNIEVLWFENVKTAFIGCILECA